MLPLAVARPGGQSLLECSPKFRATKDTKLNEGSRKSSFLRPSCTFALFVVRDFALMTMMTIMTISEDFSMNLQTLNSKAMSSKTWSVAQAKAKFSEVIDKAMSEGPQTVTRKGRTAVVIVDAEEWQRKTRRVGTLADFFAASPLREGGLKLPRRTRPRIVDL